jgi:uncharacterized Ntn-hydrolase superfamily protein
MTKKLFMLITLMLLHAATAMATFSIVAIDPKTGDLGVAVASRYFAVGSVVPWAEAGVGAIATQAGVNVGYGPRGLELLKQGLTAQQVLDRLLQEDTFGSTDGRQVGIVDAKGNIATKSGGQAWQGHRVGATWTAQGNILVGPQVVEAMGKAFDATNDDLVEKLWAALKAGDAEGGDSRGRESASILVVRKGGGRNTNNDRLVYVNVDDNPDPFAELRRLLNIAQRGNYNSAMGRALTANKYDEALNAAEHLVRYDPLNGSPYVTLGFVAYLADKKDQALAAFNRAKGLTLPNQFMDLWNAATGQGGNRGGRGDAAGANDAPAGGGGRGGRGGAGGSRYQKVLDDKAFVAKVLGG